MNKQLLIDCMPFCIIKDSMSLNESLTGNHPNGKMVVRGILQRAETKNQNGRIYHLDVLRREAKRYEETRVKESRAMGELDHPNESIVNLKNVSHNILELSWDGSNLIGTVEILPTPSGNILKSLLQSGIKLGISSRGMGTVKELSEGTSEVQDDYELIAFDFVSDPSVQGAFMYPVNSLNESKNSNSQKSNKWELVDGVVRDILSEIK